VSGEAFVCRMCGDCCRGSGGIVITEQEAERISTHLELDLQPFLDRFTVTRGGKRQIASHEGVCVFLGRNGCTVHSVKPDVCRAWPFFRGNLIDESSWSLSQDSCQGIVAEVGHPEFVRQGLEYLQSHGLLRDAEGLDEQTPNALKVGDIPKR
jgi:uncharacterized protein